MIDKTGLVYVAGASGLVGRAVVEAFKRRGHPVLQGRVDLRNPVSVEKFFTDHRPSYVVLCAAKVGGIMDHTNHPVEFINDNMRIQMNVMEEAGIHAVKKLLFLGSACAYPKYAMTPISEAALLTGPLEPSNKGYALSKILGIELCKAHRKQYGRNFISCMPTNLYGPGDHYDLENSHVIPGMMRRFHEAKLANAQEVTLWGTGEPTREFLYSEDLAEAIVHLMYYYNDAETINIGSGGSINLKTLAMFMADRVQFNGAVRWDKKKPDGTPDRLLDSSKIFALGWKPQVGLETGLHNTYQDFLNRWPQL